MKKRLKKKSLNILGILTLCLTLGGCSAASALVDAALPDAVTAAAEDSQEPGQDPQARGNEIAPSGREKDPDAREARISDPDQSDQSGIDENQIPLTSAGPGEDAAPGPVAAADIPSRYDSRDAGRTAPVRDQRNLGTCWAFASLSALESRLLPGESWDFSEDHMSHDPYFRLGQTGGGEYTMAMAYLLSWRGPVTEDEDPYGDEVSPSGLTPSKHVQEILILPDNDINAVKNAVMQWGSVETSVYMDMRYLNERTEFYNPDTAAYCCTSDMTPNHDIVIVGWDDDFPKEAFTQPVQGNGAFLCENNWGTEFGEDGFFYVSYEDRTIGSDNVVYPVVEPVSNYSNIYQCDACGWIGQMGYNEESAWAANVYRTDRAAQLAAAGFYAIDKDTSYEIYVARNIPEDPRDSAFQDREKVAEGRLSYAGYYTIPFDKQVNLGSGERFAVIIHLTTPGAIHPIAIEYDSGDGKCVIELDGESYASYDGRYWEHTQATQQCDICLKAYAR